ncbi:MAG: hypothetical protein ABW046_23450 [Actinoplanes sp.]
MHVFATLTDYDQVICSEFAQLSTGGDALDKTAAMETGLADLRGSTLGQLCQRTLQDALEPYRQILISQVERPRPNIGSGPPGRAD